jgi:hypothetical protein
MKLAALRTVALIDKYEKLAKGRARLFLKLFDEGVEITNVLLSELVYKRAQQAGLCLAQLRH